MRVCVRARARVCVCVCLQGVFLCVDCSGMHRKLSSDFSRVKSVRLDNWKPAEVEEMSFKGNATSNKLFLARLAPFRSIYVLPRR